MISKQKESSKIRQSSKTEDCVDNNDDCPNWASIGECEANPSYMLSNCKLSCKVCQDPCISPDYHYDEKNNRNGLCSNNC